MNSLLVDATTHHLCDYGYCATPTPPPSVFNLVYTYCNILMYPVYTHVAEHSRTLSEYCSLASRACTWNQYIVCVSPTRQLMLLLKPSRAWDVDWIPFQKIRWSAFPFPSVSTNLSWHLYLDVPVCVDVHKVPVLFAECLRRHVTIWSNWLKQQQRNVKWA